MPPEELTSLDNPDEAETTEEEAAASSTEETEVEGTEEQEEAKQEVDGKTKRISTLSFKNREFQRKSAEDAATIESLRKQVAGKETTPVATTDAVEPKPDDFESDLEYLRAAAKYDLKVELAKSEADRERKAQSARSTSEASELRKEFETKVDAGFVEYGEEFDDALNNPAHTPSMQRHIASSGKMSAIAMHLLKHPEVADEMAALPDKEVEKKVWYLETVTLATPKSKVRSKAPTPPTKLKSTKAPTGTVDFSKVSGDEFRRNRVKERTKAAAQ